MQPISISPPIFHSQRHVRIFWSKNRFFLPLPRICTECERHAAGKAILRPNITSLHIKHLQTAQSARRRAPYLVNPGLLYYACRVPCFAPYLWELYLASLHAAQHGWLWQAAGLIRKR